MMSLCPFSSNVRQEYDSDEDQRDPSSRNKPKSSDVTTTSNPQRREEEEDDDHRTETQPIVEIAAERKKLINGHDETATPQPEESGVNQLKRGGGSSICAGRLSPSPPTSSPTAAASVVEEENNKLRKDLEAAKAKVTTYEKVICELREERAKRKVAEAEQNKQTHHPSSAHKLATLNRELRDTREKHKSTLKATESKYERELGSLEKDYYTLRRYYDKVKHENERLRSRLSLAEKKAERRIVTFRGDSTKRTSRSIARAFQKAQHNQRLESSTQTKLQLLETRSASQTDEKQRKLGQSHTGGLMESENRALISSQAEMNETSSLELLKQRIHELEQDNQRYKDEVESARKEARDAKSSSSSSPSLLFRMIQNSFRKRADHRLVEEGDFPNGDMLIRETKRCQKQTSSFFSDLASVYEEEQEEKLSRSGSDGTSNAYEIIFYKVLIPCADMARTRAVEFLTSNRNKLEEFVGATKGMDEDLVQMFWLSTMQKAACELRTDDKRACSMIGFTNESELKEEYPKVLLWASGNQVVNHEDIDGNIESFMKMLFLLELECALSDPPCFLWPKVGTRHSFSKPLHSQHYLDSANRATRDGDKVVVLFPGIYHGDPTKDDDLEPVVKAKVILFQSKQAKTGMSDVQDDPEVCGFEI